MFWSGYIVILVAASCLTTNEARSRQKRVIGGDKYTKGEYPYHVSLWYMGDNNPYTMNTPDLHHTCGGVLVGERWVLSSAACFDDNYLPGLANTSLWKVYLGMYAQTDADKEAQYHQIEEVFMVPQYNLSAMYGDLALLKLDKAATLDDTVGMVGINKDRNCPSEGQDVCVIGWGQTQNLWGVTGRGGNTDWTIRRFVVGINKDPNCPSEGQDVCVIGWGQTQNKTYGLGSDFPYKATVKVSNTKLCSDVYLVPGGGNLRIDERSVCAGLPEGGVDGCYGDSGSPVLGACGADDSMVVVGTVSYGNGCGKPHTPSVNTRVSAYYDWIQDTIKDNS